MKTLKAGIILTVATIMLGTGVAFAASDVVTLKLAHFWPSSSHFNKDIVVPWCDKIARESGGRLKCQIFPSMQLGGTPAQLFDQVRDGVADLAWTLPSYQAGRFTKSEVFELPFMAKHPETASQAMWDYIQKNALDEYKGVKLIATHLHDGAHLHFGSKSVKTLEDLKGLRIRATSRVDSKTLAALGAVPVQMPMPAVPEAIAKSVVDGTSLPWEISTAYKIQEICKSHTETPPNQPKRANAIFVLAMNPAKYNKLPADLKKVIDQNSGRETSRWVGKVWDSGTAPARKIAADRHNIINVLSDAEYKRWVNVTQSIDDEWIKEVGAKGGDGNALLKDAKALLLKYHD
ncbi:MAG: TRAP transporter substrate-binding protein [Geobacteraceae bacterium]|nr:TRAP transporter substrate-binding protein [Geobacteraceae bacterium]